MRETETYLERHLTFGSGSGGREQVVVVGKRQVMVVVENKL